MSQCVRQGGGAGIGLGVAGTDRYHQHGCVVAIEVEIQLAQSLSHHMHQARILAEGVCPEDVRVRGFGLRLSDDVRDIHSGVVGVG